ncbi:MAG: hypothetical protein G8237_10995 [Magnetococcales bacterium]|nr:hypothetical protein [Magnetococcales bacterium]
MATFNGTEGSDTLTGGVDNDTFTGGEGTDNLFGGEGDDTFAYYYNTEINGLSEALHGGAGTDTIQLWNWGYSYDFSSATLNSIEVVDLQYGHVTLSPTQINAIGTFQGSLQTSDNFIYLSTSGVVDFSQKVMNSVERIYGSSGDDTITGTAYADELRGGSGRDQLIGGDESDVLLGEDGNDTLTGGEGNDTLEGGGGTDIMYGSTGDDLFVYHESNEINGLAETVDGGDGTDTIRLVQWSVNMNLTAATLVGIEIVDLTYAHVVLSPTQLAMITTFEGSATQSDNYIYLGSAGTVDFSTKTLNSIEKIYGSSGNDTITGTANADVIHGQAGSDTISGGEDADSLFGVEGADTLNGGGGNDILTGGTGTDTLRGGGDDDLFAYSDTGEINGLAEVIDGGDGLDQIQLSQWGVSFNLASAVMTSIESVDLVNSHVTLTAAQIGMITTFQGSAGQADNYIYLSGAGTVDFSSKSLISIERIYGSSGSDTITGTDNADAIVGQAGSDAITGGADNDQLWGNEGNDTLNGGSGNDILQGGVGTDILRGGLDDDILQYADTVEINGLAEGIDGGDGTDTIAFVNQWGTNFNFAAATFTSIETLSLNYAHVTLNATQFAMITTFEGSPTPGDNYLYLSSAGTINLSTKTLTSIERIYGSTGDDTITGTANADELHGQAGRDILNGGDEGDSLFGDEGNDTLSGENGSDTLNGGIGTDTLRGGAGNDQFHFGESAEINGLAEVIDGGDGADTIQLSQWGVQFNLSSATLTSIETLALNYSHATLSAAQFGAVGTFLGSATSDNYLYLGGSGSIDLSTRTLTSIERVYGSSGDDTITGTANADNLSGQAGNDILTGGAGNDTLTGGAGTDAYLFHPGAGSDTIDNSTEATSGETNAIRFGNTIAWTNLTFSDSGNDLLIHYGTNDQIRLLGWNNAWDVNARNIHLEISGVSKTIEELRNPNGPAVTLEGPSTIQEGNSGSSEATYTVRLSSALSSAATVQYATSNGTGVAGNDYTATNGTLNIPAGQTSVTFTVPVTGDTTIEPNETFTVTLSNPSGVSLGTTVAITTTITNDDSANSGNTIFKDTSYTLAGNEINLTLTGSAPIHGTGNSLNNVITGNSAANTLTGEGGADRLLGGSGNDHLYGGDGDDYLNGGSGSDRMFGGAGNDTYVVTYSGDVVTEESGSGTDLVESSISLTLGTSVENLTLTGTAAINGMGNGSDNIMIGNASDNTLNGMGGNDILRGEAGNDILIGSTGDDTLEGGSGADRMIGGSGNDTYAVSNSGDRVVEDASAGNDLVRSSVSHTLAANVENLTLTGTSAINATGNSLGNTLIGNSAANKLYGYSGNDTLKGGSGHDTLSGGTGADVLVGGKGEDVVTGGDGADQFKFFYSSEGGDTITDFQITQGDQLLFVSRNFGNLAPGKLDESRLAFNSTGRASNTTQRFVFNTATGMLKYDADGSGSEASSVVIATLNNTTGLTSTQLLNQFAIVAS